MCMNEDKTEEKVEDTAEDRTENKTGDKTENTTEVKTEDKSERNQADINNLAKTTVNELIRVEEKNLIICKKTVSLSHKLRKCAQNQAEVLNEMQRPRVYSTWVIMDKLFRKYKEFNDSAKEHYEIKQKTLESFKELQEYIVVSGIDVDDKLMSSLTDWLESAKDYSKFVEERFEHWKKELEPLQKDYRKYQIKLLKLQISEYRKKLPAAEKKLRKLLEKED